MSQSVLEWRENLADKCCRTLAANIISSSASCLIYKSHKHPKSDTENYGPNRLWFPVIMATIRRYGWLLVIWRPDVYKRKKIKGLILHLPRTTSSQQSSLTRRAFKFCGFSSHLKGRNNNEAFHTQCSGHGAHARCPRRPDGGPESKLGRPPGHSLGVGVRLTVSFQLSHLPD